MVLQNQLLHLGSIHISIYVLMKQCNDHHGCLTILQFSAPCAAMLHSHCAITVYVCQTGDVFNGKKVSTIKSKSHYKFNIVHLP